jgi:hypothetical protein
MDIGNDRKKWMHIPRCHWFSESTGRETMTDDTHRSGDFNQAKFVMRQWHVVEGNYTTEPDLDIIRLEDAEAAREKIDLSNYTRE